MNNTEVAECDFCARLGITKKAIIDAPTKMGCWANMCKAHHYRYGTGIDKSPDPGKLSEK